ncbi:MAG: hypothetical protein Kow0029_02440 [Candidatus Rifleibacteriota bacterium]
MKIIRAKSISIFFLILGIALILGCGGGGGGSSSISPVGPITDPGTAALATSGSMYAYSSTASMVAMKLPVDSTAANFALVVTNPNTSSQDIRIKPESYVLGTVRDPSENLRGSMPVDAYGQLLLNQAPVENRLRQLASRRAAGGGLDVRASRTLRASDNSAEKVGDSVTLYIIADTFGWNYSPRICKIERISANCKIFVDQGEYLGLSAVSGVDAVTSEDLDHFVTEFETHIFPLMNNNYGQYWDIDADGKVSLVISPVYARLGFAGLFNSNNFTDDANSNHRDMIAVFSPDSAKGWSGEKWREATRETICHEFQHLINYSAHMHFNNVGSMEEEWLDESLSVGAEARYRIQRGDPILENRFSRWAASPSSVGLLKFNSDLAQYGMVGLFNFFLYQQSGAATIRSMVNSTRLGRANIDNLFSAKGGMNGMFRNWAMATMIDTLQTKKMINAGNINSDYKYSTHIGLSVNYTEVPFGYSSVSTSVPSYGAAFYLLRQPANFTSSEYQFRVESEKGKQIDILMVRIP